VSDLDPRNVGDGVEWAGAPLDRDAEVACAGAVLCNEGGGQEQNP
jgi:hypothetical protein